MKLLVLAGAMSLCACGGIEVSAKVSGDSDVEPADVRGDVEAASEVAPDCNDLSVDLPVVFEDDIPDRMQSAISDPIADGVYELALVQRYTGSGGQVGVVPGTGRSSRFVLSNGVVQYVENDGSNIFRTNYRAIRNGSDWTWTDTCASPGTVRRWTRLLSGWVALEVDEPIDPGVVRTYKAQ